MSKTQPTTDATTDTTTDTAAIEQFPSAPFFRRLASWVYDLLTGVAIAMLATVVGMIVTEMLVAYEFIDTSKYEDTAAFFQDTWIFPFYLITCLTCFFCYFWVKGGQTIGMRAWRLRVVNTQGEGISIIQAVIRFYASLAGLGNVWVLLDWKNKQSIQDYLAKTRTITLTKEANKEIYRQS
ncbi:MAG: putative RDD family membrane protein YckC [Alteromonadaceae bacterium]|jgi:uncharacterized RDD family membrane protein YckC